MAGEPRDDAKKGSDADRLRALEERLAAKTAPARMPGPPGKYEQANLAWRMVTELVTGLGLGGAIGYGLDHLLGTMPLLMVIFIFLGLAAGIKAMMRTAGEIGKDPGQRSGSDKRD